MAKRKKGKPVNIRINAILLDNFVQECNEQGLEYTEVLHCLMADYLQQRKIFKAQFLQEKKPQE